MRLESPDFEAVRQQVLALLGNRAPELGLSSAEFGGQFAGAQAGTAQTVAAAVGDASLLAVPSGESSRSDINTWAVALGLPNGAGGFGLRGPTAASGASGLLTGRAGVVFAAGSQAIAPGAIRLVLRDEVRIPGTSGSGSVLGTWDVDASDPGSLGTKGNLPAGTVCNLSPPPTGAGAAFTLTTGMQSPGRDEETAAEGYLRVQDIAQLPPNGGNATSAKAWITGATDEAGAPISSTLPTIYVYPNYDGIGDMLLVLAMPGEGRARIPGAELLSAYRAVVNGSPTRAGIAPNGVSVAIGGPSMPTTRALKLRVRCVPSQAIYAFDWIRGSTNITLFDYATAGLPTWATDAGANAIITLDGPPVGTGTAPVSLTDAIDAGRGPRVYLDMIDLTPTFRGAIVPPQAPAVAWRNVAGKTVLALKIDDLAAWVFQPGNSVYSGGPIVEPVGARVLELLARLGPARRALDGRAIADPARSWTDTLAISSLTTAAESTTDATGTVLIVDSCILNDIAPIDGSYIAIGPAGAPSTATVEPRDVGIGAPEVLYAGRVLITD